LPLRGLDPRAEYTVHELDVDTVPMTATGRELMEHGLAVTIADRPGAAIAEYRKQGNAPR
jgi:hypothetical protein